MSENQSGSRKRGLDDNTGNEGVPKKQQICIIHYTASKCDTFTFLSDLPDPAEKLRHIHNVRDLRMSQPPGTKSRMEAVCEQIPSDIEEPLGYHRDCYRNFTRHLERLEKPEAHPVPGTSSKKTKRSGTQSKVLFSNDCIFCDKEGQNRVKKGGTWTTEPTQCFQSDAWKTVIESAELKKDEKLLVRIRGVDLFAAEAKFHPSCRKKYVIDPESWKSTDSKVKLYQDELENAHEGAFNEVCNRVKKEILSENKVLKLSDLLSTYTQYLEGTDVANSEYRGSKLKAKLVKYFGKELEFCKPKSAGKFESLLVYSSNMKLESAVRNAFFLGCKDVVADTAIDLRNAILKAFHQAEDLKWPPTADTVIEDMEKIVPNDLSDFLKFVLSGKTIDTSSQTDRLVSSIGQDICRAVTNGEWKLPKHILVAMTLRHLYRSKQLTTLMNRLGHCESHSFSIEIETAIATAVEQSSSYLSPQIVRQPNVPSLFHAEFDNFDQLLNTMSGADSVHTAHGIMLQELELQTQDTDHGGMLPGVPTIPRTNKRTLDLPLREELPACFVGQRKSPSYPVTKHVHPGSEGSVTLVSYMNVVWLCIRQQSSLNGQEVPGWAGFVSVTGDIPKRLTTIDYFPVIHNPITEYKTVQECLRYAEEASKEVGQTYTVTTFDLGVCMKAYPLIWNEPEKYKKHIIMIGTFHLICAYLRMVGKKMAGSGLSDVMLEAGLIGSGSIVGVLSGKHYERAMHCHKVVLECLERLLIEQFCTKNDLETVFDGLSDVAKEKLESLVQFPSKDILQDTLINDEVNVRIQEYCDFKRNVRNGELGKTAKFWLTYMDHIWLILALIHSVKTNTFRLYADCLHQMADMFFSFDGQNYARYLTFYSTFIANLEETHPGATELLERGGMSVARSFIPGNRCAVDKTMEETFMKHAKSRSGSGMSGSGVTGLTRNFDAYQRWVRTTHERSKFVEATLNMADMLTNEELGKKHRDLRPVEIQKSDNEVRETMDAIRGFLDPFSMDEKNTLYCISSGVQVPSEYEDDILKAEEKGTEAKQKFIENRLETQEKFFDPIKRLNLKTMEKLNKKVTVTTGKNKVVEYRQQGNVAMQLLVLSQSPDIQFDLAELMKYPLTPVPFSIGTADGCLAKTDKSKGLKYLIEGVEFANPPAQDTTVLVIEDGNALFHSMREIPSNFKQISEKLFKMVPQKSDVIFSTDMYLENSVKSMERARRGYSEKLLVQGENTKRPADWKTFLTNDDNKTQLVQIMCRSWRDDAYASKLKGRQVILICEGEAFHYTSHDGNTTVTTTIDSLKSTQEETDTRVVFYILYAKEQGYKTVQVRTPDSDIFFIILFFSDMFEGITVLFDTGSGNHRKLINMTELADTHTPEYRSALLGLHAYCGCDSTSAFKGRGHVTPIKTIEKRPVFAASLASLGNSWDVSHELERDLGAFTCAMYGNVRLKDVDEFRLLKIKEKCEDKPTDALRNIDLSSLPPCKKCLLQHIKRVNFQVRIWKQAHIADPNIPAVSQEEHGWTLANGTVEPLWIDGDLLPPMLVDVLEGALEADDVDEDDDLLDTSEEYEEDN